MRNGKLYYMRDGESFRETGLGSGLRKAVAGNPQAAAAAEEYHDHMVNGLAGVIVAGLCGGVEVGRAIAHAAREEDFDGYDAGLIGCFVVAYVIGLQQIASGQPYMYDAINIYNDSLEDFVPRPPNGGTWIPPSSSPPAR